MRIDDSNNPWTSGDTVSPIANFLQVPVLAVIILISIISMDNANLFLGVLESLVVYDWVERIKT